MKSKCLLRRSDRSEEIILRGHNLPPFSGKNQSSTLSGWSMMVLWWYCDELSSLDGASVPVLSTYSNNSKQFSFYESQSHRLLLKIDFFLNAAENQYDSSFTVLYTVWMALADSPPRSHQHKCVMSHWWQGDYIVLEGQQQCLFPQIQSTVHTGKKEREKVAEI